MIGQPMVRSSVSFKEEKYENTFRKEAGNDSDLY